MLEGNAVLVIDLGNSETRVMTIFGKTSKGKPRTRLSLIENTYAEVVDSLVNQYATDDNYSGDTSRIMKVQGGYVCNGEMCEKEFGVQAIRPSANEKKYVQDVTLWTITNALRQGIQDVAEMSGIRENAVAVDWDITVLLPAEDLEDGAEKIANMIKSVKKVSFVLPEIENDITVSSVKVLAEGHCAYMGVLLEKGKTWRDGYKNLLTESTLVIDIGAGTTDFLVIEDAKVIRSTRFTLAKGGNNVHQELRKQLRTEGLDLPEAKVKKGVIEGFVKDGAKTIGIHKQISMAKAKVANELVNGLRDFFEQTSYPVRTIANLLVCGGGAESSDVEGIRPIADYLVTYMKKLSDNVELVELPVIEIDGDVSKLSPRLLNILGAGVLSEPK